MVAQHEDGWQLLATGSAEAAAVLKELKAEHIATGGLVSLVPKASKEIAQQSLDDTTFIIDLGNVTRLFKAWCAAMPRVTPFYAVKCNPEPGMMRILYALGAGFDCASMGEVELALKLGVEPSRIIFAHPCKRAADITYAKAHGIEYTTFDTMSELHKVAAQNPGFKLVLRIRADDPEAAFQLGIKFGAEKAEVPMLLQAAKDMGLNVVGVSFHVGSGCKNLSAYGDAIAAARLVFDQATALGHHMELLDLGGGYTGHFDEEGNVMCGKIASIINTALEQHFPLVSFPSVRVISEPGQYFAETVGTLLTPVYGQRDRVATNGEISKDYWITDGIYGSLNCTIFSDVHPGYTVVRSPKLPEFASTTTYKSTIWGPTCDAVDCVYRDHMLPALRNGDWLLFPHVGAYTVAMARNVDGIDATQPKTIYVFSDSAVDGVAQA